MIEELKLPQPSPAEMVRRVCASLRNHADKTVGYQKIAEMYLADPNFTDQVQEIYDHIGEGTTEKTLARVRIICKRHMVKLEQAAAAKLQAEEQERAAALPIWGLF